MSHLRLNGTMRVYLYFNALDCFYIEDDEATEFRFPMGKVCYWLSELLEF